LKRSDVFSYYYSVLENSNTTYTVIADGKKLPSGGTSGGYFDARDNTIGIGESMTSYIKAQELFHAFQTDGKFYENDKPIPFSTRETEGDVLSLYVLNDAGSVITQNGNWIEDIFWDAADQNPNSAKLESDEYKKMFQEAVDKRIDFYKKKKSKDHPTYIQPNTKVEPKAMIAAVKGAEEKSMKNWHAPMKIPDNQPEYKEKYMWEK
jgi:hypothetical protein